MKLEIKKTIDKIKRAPSDLYQDAVYSTKRNVGDYIGKFTQRQTLPPSFVKEHQIRMKNEGENALDVIKRITNKK